MGNRRIFQNQAILTRAQRFKTDISLLQTIMRHASSRCSSYWLGIRNISSSGLAAEHQGAAFIPFANGDMVELTLDTACKIFARPIHLSCHIVRREELSGQLVLDVYHLVFGLQIISIDERHDRYWQDGLQRLYSQR